jgi:hypothetical protein
VATNGEPPHLAAVVTAMTQAAPTGSSPGLEHRLFDAIATAREQPLALCCQRLSALADAMTQPGRELTNLSLLRVKELPLILWSGAAQCVLCRPTDQGHPHRAERDW